MRESGGIPGEIRGKRGWGEKAYDSEMRPRKGWAKAREERGKGVKRVKGVRLRVCSRALRGGDRGCYAVKVG